MISSMEVFVEHPVCNTFQWCGVLNWSILRWKLCNLTGSNVKKELFSNVNFEHKPNDLHNISDMICISKMEICRCTSYCGHSADMCDREMDCLNGDDGLAICTHWSIYRCMCTCMDYWVAQSIGELYPDLYLGCLWPKFVSYLHRIVTTSGHMTHTETPNGNSITTYDTHWDT